MAKGPESLTPRAQGPLYLQPIDDLRDAFCGARDRYRLLMRRFRRYRPLQKDNSVFR